MRLTRWLLAAVLLGNAACRTAQPEAAARATPVVTCELPASPTELIPLPDEPYPGEQHEVFDLPDTPEWWAPAPPDAERERYRAALAARLGGEQSLGHRALLERVHATHAALVGKPMAREAENSGRVLEGTAGSVGPISCLEWSLFQRQAHRFPMIERPTEFGAYVLRGHGRIRVYLSGADRIGGRLYSGVWDRVTADAAQGFVPVAHVHNHPLMFDRKPGDRMWTTPETVNDIGGGVAPSLTDVQAWRRMRESFGLQGAWVTNGLETGRYTSEDFDRLSAWD
ncbi:hypothetical protein JY651_08740 [Pyxidicoccus parkwayensis]|uniref:Lipoprotein n=1 Tax=Pyxidicoccus parkwayensis TaxID=2813578 RepID=A0ABX7P3I3_9BACT|nr:hypothetical protein [Pyxidicoccus parkwaysis]QSQ25001.1 hypothetical protein JY651_08740 [Pyxidicoccus parkwaysis]